jgi:hypothetical protein
MTDYITPEIIIGIPGRWKDRAALVKAIATRSGGYVFAGGVMLNLATQEGFQVDLGPTDPRVTEAFKLLSRRVLTKADMKRISEHTFMLYLIGPGGSVEAARSIMQAAAGLLNAGGDALKVETAGVVHRSKQWLRLAEDGSPQALFQAFVTLVGDTEGTIYTVGMHNLGLPDGIISGEDPTLAASLLQGLALYQLLSDRRLAPGHSFGLTPETAHHTLELGPSFHEENDRFYHNPYGMWRLQPVADL